MLQFLVIGMCAALVMGDGHVFTYRGEVIELTNIESHSGRRYWTPTNASIQEGLVVDGEEFEDSDFPWYISEVDTQNTYGDRRVFFRQEKDSHKFDVLIVTDNDDYSAVTDIYVGHGHAAGKVKLVSGQGPTIVNKKYELDIAGVVKAYGDAKYDSISESLESALLHLTMACVTQANLHQHLEDYQAYFIGDDSSTCDEDNGERMAVLVNCNSQGFENGKDRVPRLSMNGDNVYCLAKCDEGYEHTQCLREHGRRHHHEHRVRKCHEDSSCEHRDLWKSYEDHYIKYEHKAHCHDVCKRGSRSPDTLDEYYAVRARDCRCE